MLRPFIVRIIVVATISILLLTSATAQRKDSHQGLEMFINPETATSFSVLTANVGNLSLGCRKYLNNLCYKEVEQIIANNIQLLAPDIVALQEILAPWQCAAQKETNDKKVCFENQSVPQVRRLLGDAYTIVCDSRNQFECLGVRTASGSILGCESGLMCNFARTAPSYNACDQGFTASAVTVKLHDGILFDVVNVHLQSTSADCRSRTLRDLLDESIRSTIIEQDRVLILGDFNFDPWRDSDESVDVWQELFDQGWRDRSFRYHVVNNERNKPYFTSFFLLKWRTFDFVVSNFATGDLSVLGESPGSDRLDGGKGMDHRGVYGILAFEP